jgi:hypothetical protein
MNTDYTIKNFRAFDENGVTADLRPFTILTGCNNSGKSSIVKSLCLLKSFCERIEEDFGDKKKLRLDSYKIDFSHKPQNAMGTFNHVLHKTAGVSSDTLTFELISSSSFLLQDVRVNLSFKADEKDVLNNGFLSSYSISTNDGKVLFSSEKGKGYSMDLRPVKLSLLYFLYGQKAASEWQGKVSYSQFDGDAIQDEDREQWKTICQGILDNLGPRGLVQCLEWQAVHCHHSWKDGSEGSAASILSDRTITPDFLCSPSLGVFTFFPFMLSVKDYKKEDIVNLIQQKVLSGKLEPDEKISVEVFLKDFKDSAFDNIHSYVGDFENTSLFVSSSPLSFWGQPFTFPATSFTANYSIPFGGIHNSSEFPITWGALVYALDVINRKLTGKECYFIDWDTVNITPSYFMEGAMNDIFELFIEDVMANLLPGKLYYSGTNSIDVKRVYSLEDDSEFVLTVKDYLEALRLYRICESNTANSPNQPSIEYVPESFINKWLREFGLGDRCDINVIENGYGVSLRVYETPDDQIGMLVADKGYGYIQLFAIMLRIETAILNGITGDRMNNLCTDGLENIRQYFRKHSQRYPITVALEEPENHLHPAFQSKLAEMLLSAYKSFGVHFIIETHSEYFIRKMQILVSQNQDICHHISLLYINGKNRPKYKDAIDNIGINEDGTLKNEFGKGFFDESLNLTRELYNSKVVSDENEA